MQLIKFTELKAQPWKNAGGITREIAAQRAGDSIIWRLSIADVNSNGPFSNFEGLTRILTVIEGNGIHLISADHKIDALYGSPVEFDGGLAITSKLINGPICDLNVMFNAGLCRAKVEIAKHSIRLVPAGAIAVIGLTGTCMFGAGDQLSFGDTVLSEQEPVDLDLTGNASAIIVSLEMKS